MKSEAIVMFVVEYDHYSRQVETMNRILTGNRRVTNVGQKACISPELILSLTEMQEFGNASSINEVTDLMVEKWIKESHRCSSGEHPDQVSDALNQVKFNHDTSDPRGSCLDFFTSIATELHINRAQEVIINNPKVLIEQLMKNLEPAPLRNRMFRIFKFLPEEKRNDYKH